MRIDVFGFASAIELERTVHISVIRQSKRVHAVVGGTLNEFGNRACPVQEAVVAVAVQVNERSF